MTDPVLNSQRDARYDWRTPRVLFDLLDREFAFTLDGAADDYNHLCRRYLTVEEDALQADWMDERVFVNPPYGRGIARWAAKCGQAAEMGV